MKIGVCVKPVLRTDLQPHVKDGNRILIDQKDYVINPFDEYAVEEALKIKDAVSNTEVISFSLGTESSVETVYSVLSLGLDKAIFLSIQDKQLMVDSYQTAECLYEHIRKYPLDLLIMGKEAVDTNNGAVGIILATLLGWPVVTNVHHMQVHENEVTVERELGNGITVTNKVSFPCVVTVTKGINKPRYPNILGIMQARSKPKEIIELQSLDGMESPVKLHSAAYPAKKQECSIVDGSTEDIARKVVRLFREELKII